MAKWIIDPDHTVAAFVIRHMMVSNVRGQFNKINGEISFDPSDMSYSSVEAVIDVSTIYTGIKKRDDHLRSPDFFDIERYPLITFKSTFLEPIDDRRFKLTGDLTIHGITQSVTLEAEYTGQEKSPYGETSIGFAANISINREDYGLMWNVDLASGGLMVGKKVQIFLDTEADLKNG